MTKPPRPGVWGRHLLLESPPGLGSHRPGVPLTELDRMKIVQRIYCIFGKHHRNRHSVWHDGTAFRSVCAGCRTPMVRDFHGWHVIGKDEQPAAQ